MSSAPGTALRFRRGLATDRRAQAAAVLVAGLAAWLAWPPTQPSRTAHGAVAAPPKASTDVARFEALPGLQRLQRAAELPGEALMKRDLFLFEVPHPPRASSAPSPDPALAVPAIPDPRQAAIAAELEAAPKTLRYLGFLRGTPAGLIGAFMRDEEPETLRLGSAVSGWRLMDVGETAATFQSIRFPDLRFTLQAKGES